MTTLPAQGAARALAIGRRGRPRSAVVHDAIVDAAVDLLGECGYDGLTMEGVAARAGVGKATIYRRWPSKFDLVVEALDCLAEEANPALDTGDTRADLVAMATRLRDKLTSGPGDVLRGLLVESHRNPDLAHRFRTEFIAPRRAKAKEILQRGQERGDIRPDVDLDLAAELVTSVLFYRTMFSGASVSGALPEKLVDLALSGIGTEAAVSPRTRPGALRGRR